MPDEVPRLVDWEFSWHDGVLVDLQFGGLAAGHLPELRLTLDVYCDESEPRLRGGVFCASAAICRVFS